MRSIFFTILLLRTYLSFADQPDSILCDSIEVTRFYHVTVSSCVNVVFIRSQSHFIYIEGTPSAIASVKFRQEGGSLYISRRGSAAKGKVFVYLPVSVLQSIEAYDGARVCSYDPIEGDSLLLFAEE